MQQRYLTLQYILHETEPQSWQEKAILFSALHGAAVFMGHEF